MTYERGSREKEKLTQPSTGHAGTLAQVDTAETREDPTLSVCTQTDRVLESRGLQRAHVTVEVAFRPLSQETKKQNFHCKS